MRRVAKAGPLALVPPWDLIELEDGALGLIMPYGPDPSAATAPEIETLRVGLRRLGLEIADVLQVRSAHGTSFVVDWSDLRPCSS